MDKNGDGKISAQEFISYMVKHAYEMGWLGDAAPEEELEPLEDGVFRKGLHCLGKTFNNARHAFLSI